MTWNAETNIKGPKGDKGDTGPPGQSGTGTGNVIGPAGAVADRIAVYNGATGTVIKDGGKTIAELGGGAASGVTVTPAGNIAATNVQAALVELDNEKVAKAGDTMTGALALPSTGTSAAASLNFGTAGTGFNGISTSLTATTAGTQRWSIDSVNSIFAVPVRVANGGVSGPGLQFAGQTQTGFYYSSGIAAAVSGVNKLTLDASTLTSAVPVALPGDPTTALQAATKQYVDNRAVRYDAAQGLTAAQMSQGRANINVTKKNYVINGGMQVGQEWGLTAGTTDSYYAADQFRMALGHSGTSTAQLVQSPTPGGSPNRLRITVSVADATVAATDYLTINHKIEGNRIADLRFGSPTAAKTFTLQFGCKGPAGTYSVALQNGAANRVYIAEYVIAAGEANTDVVKSVVVTADTTGTWATDNTACLSIFWCLMAGTTYAIAPSLGTWSAGGALGSTNQYNFMQTTTPPNNVFELFDVSLTEGNVAPPFQLPDYVRELQLCKRYWCRFDARMQQYCTAANNFIGSYNFPVEMRVMPSVVLSGFSNVNSSNMATTGPTDNKVITVYGTATATGISSVTATLTMTGARL